MDFVHGTPYSFTQLLSFSLLYNASHIDRIGAFLAGFDTKFYPVAFLNFVNEAGLMYKDFLVGAIEDDEAEAFGVVEKFNGAGFHAKK